MNAVSTSFYKENKLVPETAKSLNFQACHLCGLTAKDFQKSFKNKKSTHKALKSLGFAPLHAAKNSRECLVKSAFRKYAAKNFEKKDKKSLKASQDIICEKLREVTGARLFEPEPAKKGNSNTGENLKLITKFPEKTASILDCSEELLFIMHEILGMLESTKKQNVNQLKTLSERAFLLFKEDYGDYSAMSPSLHRTLQHSVEFMADYQDLGFAVGELSETAQGSRLKNLVTFGVYSQNRYVGGWAQKSYQNARNLHF